MKTHRKVPEALLPKLYLFFLTLLICGYSIAQIVPPTATPSIPSTKNVKNIPVSRFLTNKDELFTSGGKYIENIGQYGETVANYGAMGKILFGYEGLEMPVLFTSKGMIHLHRRITGLSYEERERLEKKGIKEKDIDRNRVTDKVITMEWIDANLNPRIITEEKCSDYFSYGLLTQKAGAYKKLTYKDLYPGIDLIYSFNQNERPGFEYSLVVKPGADISRIRMKYGGDVKTIRQDKNGNLIIGSGIDEISVSNAVCFYADDPGQKVNSVFRINKNEIGFRLTENYDKQKTLVIDPFVSGMGGLTGADAGKAKDIDFDYAGNIYVTGGGDGNVQKLAKFNASGALQWTFTGSLSIPSWSFGGSHGGWVVEKMSGKIYLGQGLAGSGFRVIRLTSFGLYDNYITTANPGFAENWKMLWNCNGGTPKIFIAGGGSSSNIELAYLSPPSTTLIASNITGINTGHNDISDIVIDPVSNDMYSIFSTSVLNSSVDNNIYKHKPAYTSADILWKVSPGYFALREPVNRPYLSGLDNSSNTLAVNSRYLFYWDGKHLKAFNKSDGSQACSPLSISTNTLLMQGGIVADECNNIYVGSSKGIIKVFRFTGSSFDDNAAADISIAGKPTSSVYDLVYDQGRGLLYACGNGFVASIDLSAYCNGSTYTVNINPDCASLSVTASIAPAPPAGSVISYNLFDGTTPVSSNTTGIFANLTDGKNYTIAAMVNQACGGVQATAGFTAALPAILIINNPPAVCSDSTINLTSPSVTAGSTPGLNFTYWSDAAATNAVSNPANVKPGTYFIKGVSANGCTKISPVVIQALPAPIPDAGPDTVICFGNDLQLKGSGGSGYSWSPATYLSDPKIQNPTITNPGTAGSITYRLKVKSAAGCESVTDDAVKITFAAASKIYITPDTFVAIKQPLQLNVTDLTNSGFSDFLWSPTDGLNNPFIKNPVAVLDKDIVYTLQATDRNRCMVKAEVKIRVFRGPEIYVPNSFTPNGDGLNDLLKPIPIGMAEFHYLKIFNRFGQLLFTITDPNKGWNGRINGTELGYGAFIWIGEGIDYKGNIIQRKGSFMLLR